MKFNELELSDKIIRALDDMGYTEATPIQEKAIPAVLSGKDVIGQSKTGTGKTAAFGLPTVQSIDQTSKKTQAIILCPTRELCLQVAEEIRKYLKFMDSIKTVAIYGGQGIEKQIKDMKKGAQIVVGTPGRVMDHMRRKTLKLDNIKMVVLDEADEMLDMGFEEDIHTIMADVPEERQTLLFSATINARIMAITKKYLKDPEIVKIKSKELTVTAIDQYVIELKNNMKEEATTRLIDMSNAEKTIIFCNTKRKVDNLIEILKGKGYQAEALHGDIKQDQRDRIMKRFRKGEFKILVATDVVARGIDIEDLDLVINFDVPQETEYYVHRIGRTGRNGKSGVAYTFVVGKEMNKIRDIKKLTHSDMKKSKIPTIEEISKIKNKKALAHIQEVIDNEDFKNVELFKELLKQNDDVEKVALALFTILTENKLNEEKKVQDGNKMVELFISLGKKDKIMAKDIIGSITANTAVSGEDIGKIKVLDSYSFMEVPARCVDEILKCMAGNTIKRKKVNIEVADQKDNK